MAKKSTIKNNEPSQSIDLKTKIYILSVLLILSTAVFYINQFNFQSTSDAKKILEVLSSEDTNFVIENNALDSDKLDSINFDELKKELNIESEVAIYFEDSENNEIISVNGANCFGSSEIEINGVPCKSRN